MWSAFAALGYMAGNFLSGRYSERLGNDTMIRAGNIVFDFNGRAGSIHFSHRG